MLGITLNSATNTLGSAALLALLDKGASALVLLGAGYLINRQLEKLKTEMSRESELLKLKTSAQAQFLERQLSEFFWPMLLKFEKDSSLWRRIPRLSTDKNVLPNEIGDKVEINYLLPNHLEAVKIIENKAHLVQDDKLIDMLQRYIKHVAVYSALRSFGSTLNPIDIGEPYPEGLPERLKQRTLQL